MATPILPLVDRILDGKLAEVLAAYRAEGLSYEQIARRFADDHDISVVTETVRKWCVDLLDPEPTEAAG